MDNSTPTNTPALQGLNPFPDALAQNQASPSAEDTLKATNEALEKKKQEDEKQNMAKISQSMAIINPKGTSPMVKVGKAIQDPSYAGYCQQFVDDQTGAKERYPTAYATWQAKVQGGQAQTDISKAKPGDVIEFAPDSSNRNLGHAAIVTSTKNGIQLKMATYSGVESYNLKDWMKYSSQVPVGFYSP